MFEFFWSQAQDWVSKLQILGTPAWWTCTDPLGEGLAKRLSFAGLTQEAVARLCSSLECMAKQNRKPAPRLPTLSRDLCSYVWEQCCMLAPPILLMTQGILSLCCHSWDSTPLCHLSTFKPGTYPMVVDFSKFRFCALLLKILCSRLRKQGSLPALVATVIAPPNQLSAPPTFQKVVFLLVDLQVCSVRPPVDFLGVWDDSTTI